jgi:hypothetical protein
MAKRFKSFERLLPQAKRVAAIINSSNETRRLMFMKEAPSAAAKLGFELDTFDLQVTART